MINSDGTVTAYYEVVITNKGTRKVKLTKPVVDTVTVPSGFTLNEVRAFIGTTPVPGTPSRMNSFSITPEAVGEIDPGAQRIVRVEVKATADTATREQIGDGTYSSVCASGTPNSADNPTGLFNAVSLEGESDEPAGTTNNQACVDPIIIDPSVKKSPRPGPAVQVAPDGTATLVYTVTASNPSTEYPATTREITEVVSLPDTVKANGMVTVTAPASQGVTIRDAATAWTQNQFVSGGRLRLASAVELPPRATQDFVITVPIKVTANEEQWAQLRTCQSTVPGGPGGVPNIVDMNRDKDVSDNTACIPLLPPDPAKLLIKKVDFEGNALPNALFAIFAENPNSPGTMAPEPIVGSVPMVGGTVGNYATTLKPGVYYLVETRSPAGYSLLPNPVAFRVAGAEKGYAIELLNRDDAVVVEILNNESGQLILQVADVSSGELPQTGGNGHLRTYVLALLLLIVGAFGLWRRGSVN